MLLAHVPFVWVFPLFFDSVQVSNHVSVIHNLLTRNQWTILFSSFPVASFRELGAGAIFWVPFLVISLDVLQEYMWSHQLSWPLCLDTLRPRPCRKGSDSKKWPPQDRLATATCKFISWRVACLMVTNTVLSFLTFPGQQSVVLLPPPHDFEWHWILPPEILPGFDAFLLSLISPLKFYPFHPGCAVRVTCSSCPFALLSTTQPIVPVLRMSIPRKPARPLSRLSSSWMEKLCDRGVGPLPFLRQLWRKLLQSVRWQASSRYSLLKHGLDARLVSHHWDDRRKAKTACPNSILQLGICQSSARVASRRKSRAWRVAHLWRGKPLDQMMYSMEIIITSPILL